MKLVLDTNVWLDLLVFRDAAVARLEEGMRSGAHQVFIDAACAAELERVLAYELGKWSIDAGKQAACLAECRRLAVLHESSTLEKTTLLPRCADADDQKFLELALAAGADCLVTKDLELLRLAGKAPFRIVRPGEIGP